MDPNYRAMPSDWSTMERRATQEGSSTAARALLELRARIEALEAAQQPADHIADARKMVAPPAPAGGLVDGICRELPLSPGEARAVVREVAAWLRSDGPDWPSVASLLEKEANQ